jgi:FKBP-type peptidyl-prolyl cis-trans isomerase SlyD
VTTIKNGSRIRFHYTLKVEGQVMDSSDGGDPFDYVQGSNGIVPGLESQLDGLKVGDKKNIVVQPSDGYGVSDPGALQKVPKAAFNHPENLKVGDFVNGETAEGSFQARVDAIDDEHITLDLNHPLADKTLDFQIEIVEIQ